MNYKESKSILEKVKEAKKILVHCHRSPDLDSVASAMALKQALELMGKEVTIFCVDPIPKVYNFIPGTEEIKTLDPKTIDYLKYDLWFLVDTEQYGHVGLGDMVPEILKVNVDHHPGSNIGASSEVVDPLGSSTCELLYQVFEDWGISIDDELATTLLIGMVADTNSFEQNNTTAKTHMVASKLMGMGANNNYVMYKVKRSNQFELVKFWGELGKSLEIDKENKFIWTAVSHKTFKKYHVSASASSSYANMIARTVDGTNFCIVMVEKEPKVMTMSIRSRISGFDIRLIAAELGGGGHKDASGAAVVGLPFKEAVEKTLEAARKHAHQNFIPLVPLE